MGTGMKRISIVLRKLCHYMIVIPLAIVLLPVLLGIAISQWIIGDSTRGYNLFLREFLSTDYIQ
jgi:hypothetical protein